MTNRPEKHLFAAILKQAICDAYAIHKAEWWEAIQWFRETHSTWPGAFENVCDLLGLDAPTIRRKVFAHVTALVCRHASRTPTMPFPCAEPDPLYI